MEQLLFVLLICIVFLVAGRRLYGKVTTFLAGLVIVSFVLVVFLLTQIWATDSIWWATKLAASFFILAGIVFVAICIVAGTFFVHLLKVRKQEEVHYEQNN